MYSNVRMSDAGRFPPPRHEMYKGTRPALRGGARHRSTPGEICSAGTSISPNTQHRCSPSGSPGRAAPEMITFAPPLSTSHSGEKS